jgi:hypothetical protein
VDTGEIVPWEIWPRFVAGHVSSSAAEVKDTWSCTTTTSVCREKLLTFICLRATTLSYDLAHRTVRS